MPDQDAETLKSPGDFMTGTGDHGLLEQFVKALGSAYDAQKALVRDALAQDTAPKIKIAEDVNASVKTVRLRDKVINNIGILTFICTMVSIIVAVNIYTLNTMSSMMISQENRIDQSIMELKTSTAQSIMELKTSTDQSIMEQKTSIQNLESKMGNRMDRLDSKIDNVLFELSNIRETVGRMLGLENSTQKSGTVRQRPLPSSDLPSAENPGQNAPATAGQVAEPRIE
ncbi:MAG: hypothetical protein LBQ79_02130 [Deltaproteobacteria bacterium]|jgi:hypothetical protein|nr:hypothetical protein [Deltaproteobacteria bacterium]